MPSYRVETLRLIEKQSGFLRLIYFLHKNGEKHITTIIDNAGIPVHQVYSSVQKAKEMGLIDTRIDTKSYPNRNMISLTEKGRKMGDKLIEMIDLLNSDQVHFLQ